MDWNASIAILPPMPFLLVRGSPSDAKLCNPKATEGVFEFWAVGHFLWGAKFSLFQILLTFSKISMQQKNASIESLFFLSGSVKSGEECVPVYCNQTSNCKFRENIGYEVYGMWRAHRQGGFYFFIRSVYRRTLSHLHQNSREVGLLVPKWISVAPLNSSICNFDYFSRSLGDQYV